MSLRIYIITTVIACVLSAVSAFFDYRISLGILLTTCFSMFNLFLLSATMKKVVSKGDVSGVSLLMGVNILRFSLLALVIFVAIKNPQIFNIYGVTAGLILFMFALVLDTLTRKES